MKYDAQFRWREPLAALASIVLFEWLIYRGHGFSGMAAFVIGWGVLLWVGSPQRCWRLSTIVLAMLLLASSMKLVWQGSYSLVGCAILLFAAFSLTLGGTAPYLPNVSVQFMQMIPGGVFAFLYSIANIAKRWKIPGFSANVSIIVPAALVIGFGGVFILANPNLTEWVQNGLTWLSENVWEKLGTWIPVPIQFALWIGIALCTLGLIRPLSRYADPDHASAVAMRRTRRQSTEPLESIFESHYFSTYRNTLLSLIVLFVVYLGFEFSTLWFREFPKGFYYAGYAHAGAGWLTFALALATAVLSAIFRNDILLDERLPQIQKLAWIWSALNLLLAVAVYHRLAIYIEFNGMTRMRVVGLFGVTTVVVGFLLVIRKIARNLDFQWLIHRQLWTPAIAIAVYLIIPVDWLVQTWNARQVLAGHLPPAVQMTEHDVDTEGVIALFPLIDCDDAIIRDGVRGLILQHAEHLRQSQSERDVSHWTAFQYVEQRLFEKIAEHRDKLETLTDGSSPKQAVSSFRTYAYQWY